MKRTRERACPAGGERCNAGDFRHDTSLATPERASKAAMTDIPGRADSPYCGGVHEPDALHGRYHKGAPPTTRHDGG